jgi:hypothetical protein
MTQEKRHSSPDSWLCVYGVTSCDFSINAEYTFFDGHISRNKLVLGWKNKISGTYCFGPDNKIPRNKLFLGLENKILRINYFLVFLFSLKFKN